MISLEGLTLIDGPADRGRLHSPHVRPLRPRRAVAEHVSRRRSARACTTRPTPRLWFFHAVERYVAGDRRPCTRCGCSSRCFATSSSIMCEGRGSASMSIRPTVCLSQGDPHAAAHVDGRQSRRLGRHAAPGQGGRDQRACGTTRCDCSEGWCRETDEAVAADALAERAERTRKSFNERFWYGRAGYLYDIVDGEHGRRPGPAAEPGLRHLARSSGARRVALEAGARQSVGAPADAGRPAQPLARPSRLQTEIRRRPALPATPPITRERSGRG